MESTAEIHNSQNQPWAGSSAVRNTRRNTAKAAAFGPADMKAVTGVGEPSYTSGVHTWNGALATLKPNPTNISAAATATSGPGAGSCSQCRADAFQVRGASGPENQGDAVQQERGGKRAQQEIFQRRLARPRLAPAESGQDVGGDRGNFQAEEDQH